MGGKFNLAFAKRLFTRALRAFGERTIPSGECLGNIQVNEPQADGLV
ncbi:MAG: hypothetical protein NXI23_26080 [Bacteroidetes bacterium]|nr:hypothetical protein [Bacteroidota bacterium]